ncbi:hypothetical protein [Christiangramia forsetii]|uniref:Uncharacterized protein n=2 Tax=Christiangramia forsetii TaxID=411153 RepID=A0M2P0_CHRFK|nr:hypothetical protein [Christiangramia forsetii]GGG44130.1 hypothetical protein GCM10011532_30260 [Christiangramia forsetii]CAL66885.1 conserved hypothetical protein, membrane [Christiangramia forsetii KT0803]
MILLISVFATLMMTAFSYICGYISGNQFREPELLNQLINTSSLPLRPEKKSLVGWLLHVLLGFLFAEMLLLSLEYTKLSPNWIFALISGVVAGIIGILGWQIMFSLNPDPPEIRLKNFYLQLVVAHVVFSLSFIFIIE